MCQHLLSDSSYRGWGCFVFIFLRGQWSPVLNWVFPPNPGSVVFGFFVPLCLPGILDLFFLIWAKAYSGLLHIMNMLLQESCPRFSYKYSSPCIIWIFARKEHALPFWSSRLNRDSMKCFKVVQRTGRKVSILFFLCKNRVMLISQK